MRNIARLLKPGGIFFLRWIPHSRQILHWGKVPTAQSGVCKVPLTSRRSRNTQIVQPYRGRGRSACPRGWRATHRHARRIRNWNRSLDPPSDRVTLLAGSHLLLLNFRLFQESRLYYCDAPILQAPSQHRPRHDSGLKCLPGAWLDQSRNDAHGA
jgi:hypothetical protein